MKYSITNFIARLKKEANTKEEFISMVQKEIELTIEEQDGNVHFIQRSIYLQNLNEINGVVKSNAHKDQKNFGKEILEILKGFEH
jgi:hypothetical protein